MGSRSRSFTLAAMEEDVLYQVALTQVPYIGPVQARILLEHFGCAKPVFMASSSSLQRLEGIGEGRARSIRNFRNFAKAEEEVRFIQQHNIRAIPIIDKAYPRRLLNCYDAPSLLYYKGAVDLNAFHFIAVIGSRHHTEYGRHITEKLVSELSSIPICIVSGLAYGIDAIAHKSALKHGLA